MVEFNAAWTPHLSAFSSPMVVVLKDAASAPTWTAYLSALLTPVLAVVASLIAYGQWRTARNKLKLELFERRLDVYKAVVGLLELVNFLAQAPESGNLDKKRVEELAEKTRPAEFLFNRQVADYVTGVRFKTQSIAMLQSQFPEQFPDKRTIIVRAAAKIEEDKLWIVSNMFAVDKLFAPFLQLSH